MKIKKLGNRSTISKLFKRKYVVSNSLAREVVPKKDNISRGVSAPKKKPMLKDNLVLKESLALKEKLASPKKPVLKKKPLPLTSHQNIFFLSRKASLSG